MFHIPSLQRINTLLRGSKRIAVVGLSARPERPSHQVAVYLLEAGYEVIPVNPGHDMLLGRSCYANVRSVPGPVDIVDIFRKPEHVLPVVEDAIAKGAGAVWMQQGIVNEQAAELAEKSGLIVVMDRCIKIDHQNLMSTPGGGSG